jgi:DNA-binding MarR family transcriptional regulator
MGDLAEAFARFNAALLTLSAHMAADTGLTLSEMAACEHLRLDGPLTPREVGERVRLSSGAVTSLLDRLEGRGFVARSPHPSDRRSVLVHYKPQEQRVVGRLYAVLKHLNAGVAALAEGEKETVVAFLETMTKGLTEAVTAAQE